MASEKSVGSSIGNAVIFNVREFGARGNGSHASTAIQAALDACGAAGGGMVYVPPGRYLVGTLHLRSHVRFFLEGGAVLAASRELADYPLIKNRPHGDLGEPAVLYGEDLTNITIEGRGMIDGQCPPHNYPQPIPLRDAVVMARHKDLESRGIRHEYPIPVQPRPKMIRLLRCTDVRITGIHLDNGPFWNIHPWGCRRVVIDGITITANRAHGVNSDGIDPDSCEDVHISNCTINTGDDAIVLWASEFEGERRPCRNITITNCRLSSTSSAFKLCEVNEGGIDHVTLSNCVLRDSNRGIYIGISHGGSVRNVLISDVLIECTRHDWFWWGEGDPFYFMLGDKPGLIENVVLRNIIARGRGTSLVEGSAAYPLTNITFENIRLEFCVDPQVDYVQRGREAIAFRHARNLVLRNVSVHWDEPDPSKYNLPILLENIDGLTLDNITAQAADPASSIPALDLVNVSDATIRHCVAPSGTNVFLRLSGDETSEIRLGHNFLDRAASPLVAEPRELEARVLRDR